MESRDRKLKPVSALSSKIVEELAKQGFVESLIMNVTHNSRICDELADLTQIIYIALLEMEPSRLQELVEKRELKFFVVRMITNQYYSKTSPFYAEIRKFKMKSSEISSQISGSVEDKSDRLSFLTR